jgi:spore germination protein GerM
LRKEGKMKNKKIFNFFTVLLIIILIGGYLILNNLKIKNKTTTVEEYTPQEEITEEQLRQTIVSLYFQSKETKELVPEARMVDIKEIINTPYEKLISLLIEGPKNEKLEKNIPENTKLLQNYLEGDCIVLDFSIEFLNGNEDEKSKENKINSIVKTLTELTEINKVKILIEGKENSEFNEIYQRN